MRKTNPKWCLWCWLSSTDTSQRQRNDSRMTGSAYKAPSCSQPSHSNIKEEGKAKTHPIRIGSRCYSSCVSPPVATKTAGVDLVNHSLNNSLITQKNHPGIRVVTHWNTCPSSTICRKSIEKMGRQGGKEPQKLCIMHGSNFLRSCFCSTGVQEAPQEHCPHRCLHKARN